MLSHRSPRPDGQLRDGWSGRAGSAGVRGCLREPLADSAAPAPQPRASRPRPLSAPRPVSPEWRRVPAGLRVRDAGASGPVARRAGPQRAVVRDASGEPAAGPPHLRVHGGLCGPPRLHAHLQGRAGAGRESGPDPARHPQQDAAGGDAERHAGGAGREWAHRLEPRPLEPRPLADSPCRTVGCSRHVRPEPHISAPRGQPPPWRLRPEFVSFGPQSLIMVFAHLVHTQLEPLLEFLCSLPGPTGKPALEFVMAEWTGRQHLFYGQYEGKVRWASPPTPRVRSFVGHFQLPVPLLLTCV